jgi:hypothetical protein
MPWHYRRGRWRATAGWRGTARRPLAATGYNDAFPDDFGPVSVVSAPTPTYVWAQE